MDKDIIQEQCERNSDDSNVRQAHPTEIAEECKTPKDARVTASGFGRAGDVDSEI